MNRRSALRGGAATLAAGFGIGAAVRPMEDQDVDAELIRLCTAFDGIEQQWLALCNSTEKSLEGEARIEAGLDALRSEQLALLGPICTTRARTQAGIAARVYTLATGGGERLDDLLEHLNGSDAWASRMLGALLRDLVIMQAQV